MSSRDKLNNTFVVIKHLLLYSNSKIYFLKLTRIFHKCLFIPYLPQVGGNHVAKGSGLDEWKSFIALSGLPHFLISSPPVHHLFHPLHPPDLEASLPCQSYETVYSCLADITCLNGAPSYTYLPIPSTCG